MIKLIEDISIKEIPENPKKVADIFGKIFNFNEQQKTKECHSDLVTRLKILTSKWMLQRVPIALSQ